jgi:Bacterial protein of unknown function (DUF922)
LVLDYCLFSTCRNFIHRKFSAMRYSQSIAQYWRFFRDLFIYFYSKIYKFNSFIFLYFLTSIFTQAQRYLSLTNPNPTKQNVLYFWAQIDDRRSNSTKQLGRIIGASGEAVPLFLKEPLTQSLVQFWPNQRSAGSPDAYPITLIIKELLVKEEVKKGIVEGSVQLSVEFVWYRTAEPVQLTSTQSGFTYRRSLNLPGQYADWIGRSLLSVQKYFETWLKENSLLPQLARQVRVVFLPQYLPKKPTEDTLFWEERSLQWSDFRGAKPLGSVFAAAIFSNWSYDVEGTVEKGEIVLKIQLKTFMTREQSWASASVRQDSYSLAHEQVHFDITRLAVEEFKEAVRQRPVPPDQFDAHLRDLFLDTYRRLSDWQMRYDSETAHGTRPTEQARWAKDIAQRLKDRALR